jgi:hypothetical protein
MDSGGGKLVFPRARDAFLPQPFLGLIRWRRRFGWPGRLEPHERVWLTCEGLSRHARLQINGTRISPLFGNDGGGEAEITHLLSKNNALVVEVDVAPGNPGLWGEVALEVRCPAYLRAVRAWASSGAGDCRLHVKGQVVGTVDGPLELYVLLGRSTVIYSPVNSDAPGHAFGVESDRLETGASTLSGRPVRVELVQGGSLWYAVETIVAQHDAVEAG